MQRYRKPIRHMMYRMIKNREDADDLTQEAFTKAFNKIETYNPKFAFSTWLFRVASNNCIDFIRKKKLILLSIDDTIIDDDSDAFSESLKSANLDPEEQVIKQQRNRLIRNLMKHLGERYRLMIELRYFEEMTYNEIAQELDLPLGTVKAQLYRAKELLYTLMQTPTAKDHVDWKPKKKD
jgi:RNA polymerase sigma-70 factor (ECF subfamily)